MTARERYEHDPVFRNFVDAMVGALVKSHVTVEDIARAAVLAAEIYAVKFRDPVMLVIVDKNDPRFFPR